MTAPAQSGPGAHPMDEGTAARLRAMFRHVNRAMVALWRLGLGRAVNGWPSVGGRILVLGHTGRRTGLRRWTPLNYAPVDGQIYCVAGFGAVSDWYRNVRADPVVEVWLPDQRWVGTVEDVSEGPDRLRLVRAVLVASGFAAPAAGVDPRRLDDPALAEATAGYRVLRLNRVAGSPALAAHPRPGDRRWWWAPGGAVLGVLALARLVRGAQRTCTGRRS